MVKNFGGGAAGIRAIPLLAVLVAGVVRAADIVLVSPSAYDGRQPIVLDAAWFGGAADAAMRVEVVDSTNGVTYLTAAAGEREVVWNPSAAGQYRLTLQKRDGEAWTATGYARELTVDGLTTATADDIELNMATATDTDDVLLDMRGLGPWQRHTASASEALTYSSAWATNATSGAKAVVKVMPVLKTKPKYLVIDLSGGTNATSYGISYLDEVPGGTWSDEYKTSKLVLRHIPAGSFIMGRRATDYPGAVNTNLHMVTITRDFYMGVFEVTQRQWELVMGTRPSIFSNETCYAARPVERVSYADIRGGYDGLKWPNALNADDLSFLGRMRKKTSCTGFDLPTESQWEYACRAGVYSALNNGMNLSSNPYAIEMKSTDHCAWHSGWKEYKGDDMNASSWRFARDNGNALTNVGTAAVGTYSANRMGLFGCHGNVSEMCLNRYETFATGSVDPVGAVDMNAGWMWKGGSWIHSAHGCTSGYREMFGTNFTTQCQWIGFRLCLQGGDIPDLAAATTLVDESGAGSQSWTPTRSGAYYLTHSTMNGTTNAQLASAWFEVPGCTLTLEPQGELTNGVMIAVNGADEGWTVYYTTNGSVPTTNATAYAGAFSLPESGTVRAIAYNAQGIASEEVTTTFTLHDALSVVGAVARQRYPWNGMVDVDLELKGDPEAKYTVEVEAKDLDGGTNLPVRTVYVDAMVPIASNKDGLSSSDAIETIASTGVVALLPGTHCLTWNADADIAADGEFPRVAVTLKATRPSAVAAYVRSLTISTDGYAGGETLTNVPVLVRLSTNITGFAYSDFASPTNGADLAFFDANENELPYEIDEWHTNGESLVWVKLPTMRRDTRITCAYGRKLGMKNDELRIADKHLVWKEYAGVWHMNEDSGTAYDSTGHGLDALPSCGTNGDTAQMVAYPDGACGLARVNSITETFDGNHLEVPSYDSLNLQSQFVVSGWYYGVVEHVYPRFFSRKRLWTDANGWEVSMCGNQAGDARGSSAPAIDFSYCDISSTWLLLTCAYDGDVLTISTNGMFCSSGSISPASDNGLSLWIGNVVGGYDWSFVGQYDEIRLRGGSLSADRIKADYDMIANRKFCTYGAVKKVGASK